MSHPAVRPALVVCALFVLSTASRAGEPAPDAARYRPDPQELRRGYERASRAGAPVGRVYKMRLAPNWFHDNTRFWYRNDLRGGGKEFVVVDADKGTRRPAFDHKKLAEALSRAAGTEYKADRLPFNEIEFADEERSIRFQAAGAAWKCDLTSYECSKVPGKTDSAPPAPATPEPMAAVDEATDAPEVGEQPVFFQQPGRQTERLRDVRSPDGKWTAFVKEHNVWVRGADGKEVQLIQSGEAGNAFGMLSWAPSSKALVGFRIEPGDEKDVYLIESSPRGGGRARLQTRPYALPGDKFTAYEPWVFDVENRKAVKAEVDRIDFGRPRLRWLRDGRHFTYEKTDRGHQRFRVVEVDALTGQARDLIDEKTDTFIWTAHREALDRAGLPLVTYLDKTNELLYCSERDGWRHLYLIDAKEGQVKNQVTRGAWVVRGIERIDEAKRQIWFVASGKNAGQDPYFLHYYRVNFDGSGLVALTEGNGTHSVQFSPDRKYLIDTYSRVDMPPVHELRRAEDGKLVCELEKADISELRESGWEPPEVFVAKGRDGKTDIWGII
ncbi:MAG TPA: DPP IV N-terminal domain-containing protein, partial [Gemmataceae bacterium]|nr:DPP IV N-terminal domain-containing protein [Gemmataceae bacterium]